MTTTKTPARDSSNPEPLKLGNTVRIVTAASLFDGHDAAINIMRRIIQEQGVEVIHLGHNRSVNDIVTAAIQEDVQAIAVSSYQGGHLEFFKYMYDLLNEKNAGHIKIFAGGGGVIVPREIEELEAYGIEKIYSPEDGRKLGLVGMIQDAVRRSDFKTTEFDEVVSVDSISANDWDKIGKCLTLIERSHSSDDPQLAADVQKLLQGASPGNAPVIGVTGTGGAGKSSLTDEILLRLTTDFPELEIAVLSVDPSKRRTGGALLGDRIRMNSLSSGTIYMRSMATRAVGSEVSSALSDAVEFCKNVGFDVVFVETAGIGQGSSAIVDLVDIPVYVMTSEYGAASQLEKIDMLDYAEMVVLNKFERKGSSDALRDVKKQMWRNRSASKERLPEDMPVFPTIASNFNDTGVNAFYQALLSKIRDRLTLPNRQSEFTQIPGADGPERISLIAGDRVRYLSDVTHCVRDYHRWRDGQKKVASKIYATWLCLIDAGDEPPCRLESYAVEALSPSEDIAALTLSLRQRFNQLVNELEPACRQALASCPELYKSYREPENTYRVRNREISVSNYTETISGTQIPKVALPDFSDWGDMLDWLLRENVPGEFPYTAGVFPYKRQGEDPARMFAGEGPPAQTNKRFHLLAAGQPAARLSTAFDSVTLYGEDPEIRPDVYGKVGDSGVSVCTVEDAEILYSGFDLCSPTTSVSMTINGPAPTILAFFFNAAIRQQVRKALMADGTLVPVKGGEDAWQDPRNFELEWESTRKLIGDEEYLSIRERTLRSVRGTVQADILKEDQAQNTCIFSTEFSLKMMGDVQQYFIDHDINNFYSVSISGYHIAEAGANPITQLAFTLANGFTYVEYYLSRGMAIDDFAPNLSFFFSNGMDAEYSVIGRVARRIWAVAMKRLYKGNDRSQKLKYHIQTSGRSLHAMEIDFNDIRTTLQALMAIYDNCNSLHTNAYDEAITTPTEESVRRALAIQLIINKEYGLARNENALQGSFIIEELTKLVEEAVLAEFDRLTDRGGVLGAMETQYQRGKIQEESMTYEGRKHSGELPVIGVNTFLNPDARDLEVADSIELRRASNEDKDGQIAQLKAFQAKHSEASSHALQKLQEVALKGENVFAELMECVNTCSLGQVSKALYAVGGRYRRNM